MCTELGQTGLNWPEQTKASADVIAGSLESANWSILAARRHFKEVVGKKIRILL